MTKWKCDKKNCTWSPCIADVHNALLPNGCAVRKGAYAEWKKITDEPDTNCNQLPEWCTIGEWFFFASSNFEEDHRYLKITESKHGGISAKEKYDNDPCWFSFDVLKKFAKPARLRPWTAREAIGKVICWKGNFSHQENIAIIIAVDAEGFVIGDLIGNIDLQGLTMSCYYQPDGKLCGVLEHLEDGEWVQ